MERDDGCLSSATVEEVQGGRGGRDGYKNSRGLEQRQQCKRCDQDQTL